MKNKFAKLACKIFAVLVVLSVIFFIALHFVLVHFVSSENVREKIVSTLKEQLATEVNIGKISVTLFDL